MKRKLQLLNFIFLLCFFAKVYSQNQSIDSLFLKKNSNYQEVVYAHLNKSKYVKGEMLGFTAYVFNKNNKKLSSLTKNLYCSLTDENNNIIASKLFKVNEGLVNGHFIIENSLKSGTYTFSVYTNWMRNFSQKNYYTQKVEIIDGQFIFSARKEVQNFYMDAQFLPESGHLLHNVLNTVGVVIKDTLGLGIANIEGKILDEEDNYITSFKVNENGIGRFSFIPDYLKRYKAVLNNRNKLITQYITEPIQEKGLLLKIARNEENVIISIRTNTNTKLEKGYNLVFHDGNQLNKVNVDFENKTFFTKKIPFKNLSKGINVFTLFNKENKPIAERLFFNHKSIQVIKSDNSITKKEQDSLNVLLQFTKRNLGLNNVSVSVLPANTKAYQKNSNIISQTLLQPYLKGVIENADYYFNDLNEEKIQDLDNLLITQGWSSYDWKDLFLDNNSFNYKFEEGISIKVNLPKVEEKSKFLIHNLTNNPPLMIEFDEEIKSFSNTNYYPLDDEKLFISKVREKGELEQPSLYVQFNIIDIPRLKDNHKTIAIKPEYFLTENYVDFSNFEKLNQRETLNEFSIKLSLEKKRKDSIRGRSFGRVIFLSELQRTETLANFLNFKPPFVAFDDYRSGTLVVYNRRRDNQRPAVFLDGFEILSFDILYGFNLDIVEYINIDPESLRGGGGLIEIQTNAKLFRFRRKTIKEVTFPITFSSPKKFYIPKYESYNNDFYKNYGVIDWLPINKINENGILSLKINGKQSKEFTLFIEGVTKDGDFILEQETIKVE